MPEEVAVIAAQLDDPRAGVEPQAIDHCLRIAPCVRYPAIRVGREVRVFREDLLGRHVLRQLQEIAVLADVQAQGVERLHLVELVSSQESLAQG